MVNYEINHQRMTSLKKRGYHIIIVATYANVEKTIQRAELRYQAGGRHVPEGIIRSNFTRAPETLEQLHHLSDFMVLFDNNGETRRLVLNGEPGSYQIESPDLYANYLALFGNQCSLTKKPVKSDYATGLTV